MKEAPSLINGTAFIFRIKKPLLFKIKYKTN